MSKKPGEKQFKAWIDKRPGKNDTLHVEGSFTVPTTGWKASIVEAVPQG